MRRQVIVYTDSQHVKEAYRGYFHKFGCNFEELESGVGNYTTVIIEQNSGVLTQEPISRVRFINSLPRKPNYVPSPAMPVTAYGIGILD